VLERGLGDLKEHEEKHNRQRGQDLDREGKIVEHDRKSDDCQLPPKNDELPEVELLTVAIEKVRQHKSDVDIVKPRPLFVDEHHG
jgi:hypothetical protein